MMKSLSTTLFAVVTLFSFLIQPLGAQAPFIDEAKDDVAYLSTMSSVSQDDCYSFWLGDLEFSGNRSDISIPMDALLAELGKGPSVSTKPDCPKAESLQEMKMTIMYETGADVDYPIDKLDQVAENPGVGERLLYNASRVVFSNIRFSDTEGNDHVMEDKVFIVQ